MSNLRAYFLVGPTAAGKSAVAHRLALARDLDILSADAMQVYRGMDIGTAKPTAEERAQVRYWGLDLADLQQAFSVAQYVDFAADAAARLSAGSRGLIVAGGSGLYVKALTHGLTTAPAADAETRSRVRQVFQEGGIRALQERILAASPELYHSLPDKHNPRRLMRTLELAELGVTAPPAEWKPMGTGPRITGLLPERSFLAGRIRTRVFAMYAAGLLDEVRRLLPHGLAATPTACHAVGYAEAIDCLQGRISKEDAVDRTVTRTLRLAKRQLTWFRHQANVDWIPVDAGTNPDSIVKTVWASWEKHGPTSIAPRT